MDPTSPARQRMRDALHVATFLLLLWCVFLLSNWRKGRSTISVEWDSRGTRQHVEVVGAQGEDEVSVSADLERMVRLRAVGYPLPVQESK